MSLFRIYIYILETHVIGATIYNTIKRLLKLLFSHNINNVIIHYLKFN